MHKFIDPLPGLCHPGPIGPIPACDPAVKSIPLAVPDNTTFGAGSTITRSPSCSTRADVFGVADAGTLLRGYVQLVPKEPGAVDLGDPLNAWIQYSRLFARPSPATSGRPSSRRAATQCNRMQSESGHDPPVRIKFTNLLPSGRQEPLHPTDTPTWVQGWSTGRPTRRTSYLHLHGATRPGSATGRLTSGPLRRETPLLPT